MLGTDTTAQQVLSLDELNDFSLDGVEAKVRRAIPAGKYIFAIKEAELSPREREAEGGIVENVVDCKFTFEIVKVLSFVNPKSADGTDHNPDDFIGSVTGKTFWKITPKSVKYLKGFMQSMIGAPVAGKLTEVLSTLETENMQFGGTIKHRPNKDDPSSPYVDMREEPEHIIPFATLKERNELVG